MLVDSATVVFQSGGSIISPAVCERVSCAKALPMLVSVSPSICSHFVAIHTTDIFLITKWSTFLMFINFSGFIHELSFKSITHSFAEFLFFILVGV